MSRVYFTDRDLGRQFPSILAAAGLAVERHQDLFPPAGSDEQWLEYCGTQERIAITHDQRIRYKVNEREAVMRHHVGLLVLVGHVPFSELARNFLRTLTRVEAFIDERRPPFIAKIYRPSPLDLSRNPESAGRIELWYPR